MLTDAQVRKIKTIGKESQIITYDRNLAHITAGGLGYREF